MKTSLPALSTKKLRQGSKLLWMFMLDHPLLVVCGILFSGVSAFALFSFQVMVHPDLAAKQDHLTLFGQAFNQVETWLRETTLAQSSREKTQAEPSPTVGPEAADLPQTAPPWSPPWGLAPGLLLAILAGSTLGALAVTGGLWLIHRESDRLQRMVQGPASYGVGALGPVAVFWENPQPQDHSPSEPPLDSPLSPAPDSQAIAHQEEVSVVAIPPALEGLNLTITLSDNPVIPVPEATPMADLTPPPLVDLVDLRHQGSLAAFYAPPEESPPITHQDDPPTPKSA